MEDKDIVALYWQRNQDAISETAAKYGSYCRSIAMRILENNEDALECVNDTYLGAWNSIPPYRPSFLATYLGKITRRLSFDRFRQKNAGKRGGGEIALVLDELAECVSGTESVEDAFARKELIAEINAFLNTLSQEKCSIFLCRYWYALPVSEIAERFGKTENSISVTLNRTRSKLKKHLAEKGYEL